MIDALSKLPNQLPVVWRALVLLPFAAVLAGMLGFVRPIRRQVAPRSFHVSRASNMRCGKKALRTTSGEPRQASCDTRSQYRSTSVSRS